MYCNFASKKIMETPKISSKKEARNLPQHVVDADDAVGPGGAGIVHHGRVRLHPRPAATLGQKSVVLGRHLALEHHCGQPQWWWEESASALHGGEDKIEKMKISFVKERERKRGRGGKRERESVI